MELFRQKTRSVGFVAPDGRTSPALADSISDIETTVVVAAERNEVQQVPPRSLGLLGFYNPFLLGSVAPMSDENSKENDSLEKGSFSLEKADDNSYEILLEKGILPFNDDESATQRSGEIDPAAPPSEQIASITFLEHVHSLNPTPRISNEANRGLFSSADPPKKDVEIANDASEVFSASTEPPLDHVTSNDMKDASLSSSHHRKAKEPVVPRGVSASKSCSFFDDEDDEDASSSKERDALEMAPTLPKVAIGHPSNVPESLELSSGTVPAICEANSDDFDATADRYRSVEETPIPPPHLPSQKESYAAENALLLHRIISFVGKEEKATGDLSPSIKNLLWTRWEGRVTPQSKALVERCWKYAAFERAIATAEDEGTLEAEPSSGSGFTGPSLSMFPNSSNVPNDDDEDEISVPQNPFMDPGLEEEVAAASSWRTALVAPNSEPSDAPGIFETNDSIHSQNATQVDFPHKQEKDEEFLVLNLGGDAVQRLVLTNSIDRTLQSLEAFWNEPNFTESEEEELNLPLEEGNTEELVQKDDGSGNI